MYVSSPSSLLLLLLLLFLSISLLSFWRHPSRVLRQHASGKVHESILSLFSLFFFSLSFQNLAQHPLLTNYMIALHSWFTLELNSFFGKDVPYGLHSQVISYTHTRFSLSLFFYFLYQFKILANTPLKLNWYLEKSLWFAFTLYTLTLTLFLSLSLSLSLFYLYIFQSVFSSKALCTDHC